MGVQQPFSYYHVCKENQTQEYEAFPNDLNTKDWFRREDNIFQMFIFWIDNFKYKLNNGSLLCLH